MRRVLKYSLVSIGGLLGLCALLVAAFLLSPNSTKRKLFFFVYGTTDPFSLLNEGSAPGERIAYGNDPSQFGELILPERGKDFPVAVLVQRGCWMKQLPGAPPQLTSLDLLRPLAHALAAKGIATWNIEYRRLGDNGGGWPGTFEDVAAAADELRSIATSHGVDLTHAFVIGHSSGGQLALWLAARSKLTESSPLYRTTPLKMSGVVDIDGPPGLAAAAEKDDLVCGAHVVSRLLGGTPNQMPSRYQQGSADALLPLHIKQELLYSGKTEFLSDNRALWSDLFTNYLSAAKSAGDDVEVTRLEKAGHFDGINPRSKNWPTVIAQIQKVAWKTNSIPAIDSTSQGKR